MCKFHRDVACWMQLIEYIGGKVDANTPPFPQDTVDGGKHWIGWFCQIPGLRRGSRGIGSEAVT